MIFYIRNKTKFTSIWQDGVDLNDVLGGGGEHQPSGGAPSRGHSGGPPRGHPGVNLPVRAGGGKLGGRPGFGKGRHKYFYTFNGNFVL